MKKIPLHKKRKEPMHNDWRRNDYSAAQIAKWVKKGGNVGLRLEPGDLVIDVDPKHADAKGSNARQLLDLLAFEFELDFSEDLIVETGGKVAGYHVHLKMPPGVRIREKLKGLFGGAIEFKTVGRQVLAPGCVHPDGGTYRTINGSARRDCPPALLAAITRPTVKKTDSDAGEVTPKRLKLALDQLDPEEFRDYDEWRNLLFACHHGTGGSEEGRDVFMAWSAQDEMHADAGGDIEYFWLAADTNRGEGRTVNTLYWQLGQRGFGMPPGDAREDFADIIEELREANPPPPFKPDWRMNENGKIRSALVHNIRQAMRVLDHQFYRDDFTGYIHSTKTGEMLSDDHLAYLGAAISDGFDTRWTGDTDKNKRQEAIVNEAKANRIHPVRDYLGSLKWDGKRRMQSWLISHAGADTTLYIRTISELFLLAAVARIYQPGIKFDLMLVLEGKQGLGKSSLVNKLGGKWALEGLPPLRASADKDVIEAMRGYWIIEMEEMSVARKSDADILKAFLTRRIDRVRLPYERNARDFPRQCIFVGTINETEYLRDTSGNRRFAPVACTQINVEGLERDQLWAEARESWLADQDPRRLKLPAALWEEANKQQEMRRVIDPMEAGILEAITKFPGKDFVTTQDIMLQSGFVTADEQRRGQRLLSNVLTRAGLTKSRRRVKGSQPKHGWILPTEELDLL